MGTGPRPTTCTACTSSGTPARRAAASDGPDGLPGAHLAVGRLQAREGGRVGEGGLEGGRVDASGAVDRDDVSVARPAADRAGHRQRLDRADDDARGSAAPGVQQALDGDGAAVGPDEVKKTSSGRTPR